LEVWTLVKQFQAQTKDTRAQHLVVPGETMARYVRVRCLNNVRGGNLVNVRFVQVRGLPQEQVAAFNQN